jgi:hypothetical protein
MPGLQHFKNTNGQALAEAALTAPLIVLFLFSVIWFGRIVLTWQQISGAARHGTDMIAYTDFSKNEIKADIVNYLCHGRNLGRILEKSPDALKIDIEINDLPSRIDYTLGIEKVEDIERFNPVSIIETLAASNPLAPRMSYVEITYSYKVPPVLRFYKETLDIKVRSEVLSDTGSPGKNKRRER